MPVVFNFFQYIIKIAFSLYAKLFYTEVTIIVNFIKFHL